MGVGCVSATDGTLLCSYASPLSAHSTFKELVEFICETVLTMLQIDESDFGVIYDVTSIGIGCPGQCRDGLLIGACIFGKFKFP